MMARLISVNERGLRVGQDHQRARLTDRDIELLLDLHENHGWGCKRLAAKFEICHQHAARICKGKRRGQRGVNVKRVIA